MSLKSLLQRLGLISATPTDLADIVRLQGRSDWPDGGIGNVIETDGGGADLVAPWDRPGARSGRWEGETPRPQDLENRITKIAPDPWPVTDDPYANPEPCTIVPDPALAAINDPRAHALTRPMDSVKSVTDLIQLIKRQEAAEKYMTDFGYIWDGEKWTPRSW